MLYDSQTFAVTHVGTTFLHQDQNYANKEDKVGICMLTFDFACLCRVGPLAADIGLWLWCCPG